MRRHTAMRRRRLDFNRLFLAQGLAILLLALLAGLRHGQEGMLSALLGGLVALLPTLYFVWRGQRVRDGRRPRISVMNLYQAAMGKFGLTVALFVIVFIVVPPSNPIFFFVAYVAAQLMHWLTPWLLRDRPTQRT